MHVGNQMVSGTTLQRNMVAIRTVIVEVKYINSKNESVRNKDRMATEPLTILTGSKLLTYLDSIKDMFLTISILPDRYRVSDTNKRGMYEHPYALCSASNGNIIFLLTGIRKLDHLISFKCGFTVQQTAK